FPLIADLTNRGLSIREIGSLAMQFAQDSKVELRPTPDRRPGPPGVCRPAFFLNTSAGRIVHRALSSRKMNAGISAINAEVQQASLFVPTLLNEINKVVIGQKYLVER